MTADCRKLLINWGNSEFGGAFVNFMKAATSFTFPNVSDSPAKLDNDGYPNATLSGNFGGNLQIAAGFRPSTVQWVIKWPATRTAHFVLNIAVTTVSNTFSFKSGGSNSALEVGGAGGRCVFTFNDTSSNSCYFPAGAFYSSGSGEMCLCRVSDEASYDAGEYFTPEFLALYGNLKPKIVRPMGATFGASAESNVGQYRYRSTTTKFSWATANHPNGIWGGTISGTDTYTMGAATDSTADWSDMEVIQGRVTNANTSATPTLQIASRTAKTIVDSAGQALNAGDLAANSNRVFVYDGLLDKVLLVGSGVTSSVPVEAQVQLANRLGASLWVTFPHMANDDYVSQTSTYVRDNLDSTKNGYFEYANEIWNFTLNNTTLWSYNRGSALGIPDGNNRRDSGWYGLRVRQIAGVMTPLWTGVNASRLKRVMAVQGGGGTTNTDTFRFKGRDLVTTNPGYASWVGVNYDTAPNRPIDWSDCISYAPYYQGSALGDGNFYTAGMSAARKASLQAMADTYAGGHAAGAEALLDADIRTGGAAGVGGLVLSSLLSDVYPGWESLARTYDKTVACYEGGLQCLAPTTAQCTTIGVLVGGSAAAASAALTSLLSDYKNSSFGYGIVTKAFNDFFSQSNSDSGAWLTVFNGGQWALVPGTDIFGTPFQTYQAFTDYNECRPTGGLSVDPFTAEDLANLRHHQDELKKATQRRSKDKREVQAKLRDAVEEVYDKLSGIAPAVAAKVAAVVPAKAKVTETEASSATPAIDWSKVTAAQITKVIATMEAYAAQLEAEHRQQAIARADAARRQDEDDIETLLMAL